MSSKEYKSATSKFFDETEELEVENSDSKTIVFDDKKIQSINAEQEGVIDEETVKKTFAIADEDEYEEEYEEYDDEEYEEDEYDEYDEYEERESLWTKIVRNKVKVGIVLGGSLLVIISAIIVILMAGRVKYIEDVQIYVDGAKVKTYERVEEGTLDDMLIEDGYDKENYKKDKIKKSTETKIYLAAKKEITVSFSEKEWDKEKMDVYSYRLNDLITELDIDLTDEMVVYVDNVKIDSSKYKDTAIRISSSVKIVSNKTEELVEEEAIPYTVVESPDSSLTEGERKVIVKGEDGIKRTTYKVYYSNGEEVKREVLNVEIVKNAIREEVSIGTKPKTDTNTNNGGTSGGTSN